MQAHPSFTRRNARTSARIPALMAASVAGCMLATPALAQLSPALDRVSVSVGAFQTDPKLNLSMNTPYGTLQSGDIGLGKETMGRLKADLILFDSQGLSLDMYQYNHTYTGSIASNYNINGNALTTVGDANFGIKLDFAKLAYKWWLGSGDTVVGLGAGAAYYKVSMNASATASVNGSTASISDGYSDDAVAPLLELGVRHAISPNLRLFADASGVSKSDGPLKGELYNAAAGIEWFPAKNVGVVLDYSMGQLDLRRDDSAAGNLKIKFEGPSLFVKFRY